jgi:DNA primase catalytic subunit
MKATVTSSDSNPLSKDEILKTLDQHPELNDVIVKYLQIANAQTDVRCINQIEYDICDVSEELNKATMKSWIERQQKNAELSLRIQKQVKRSGKKNSVGTVL